MTLSKRPKVKTTARSLFAQDAHRSRQANDDGEKDEEDEKGFKGKHDRRPFLGLVPAGSGRGGSIDAWSCCNRGRRVLHRGLR